MDLAPGSSLGPYEILAPLGAGGMGVVYRARDPRLGREVALKVLHDGIVRDSERLRRFETEARAAGALTHPNIVAVFDVGAQDGVPYVVCELLEGESLRERLSTSPLRRGKALEYAVQIAEGLAAAHDKGIVHRDLKPENIFVTKAGRVKILDFGLAKLLHTELAPDRSTAETLSLNTEDGVVLGTVGYMSPEQVTGLPTDHRSDVFAFGVVLYEMLTGKRAFKAETTPETLTAILRADPLEKLGAGSDLRPELSRLLARCLEKKPEDRFQSARDLAFSLENLAGSGDGRDAPRVARVVRRRWLLSAAAALVLLSVATAALLVGRASRPEPRIPRYHSLTFGRGVVLSGRFGPDGETAYYTAEWEERPMEIFSTWGATQVSRPVGLVGAKLLAVSRQGEMAVLLRPRLTTIWTHRGTLARVPVSGGTPREVLDEVQDADYSRDGKDLAIVRWVEDRCRLEYPIGKTLYEPTPPAWIGQPRFSHRGDRIAFALHSTAGDLRGVVAVVDLRGAVKKLSADWGTLLGLGWSDDDGEVLLSGTTLEDGTAIVAFRDGGRERVLARPAAPISLLDMAGKGRALATGHQISSQIVALGPGARHERDLSEQSTSYLADISLDGTTIVGTSQQGVDTVFLRRTDGTPAIRLGEGNALALSRDGAWVLVRLPRQPAEALVILPTRTGEPRELPAGDVEHYFEGTCFPDGKRIVFSGAKKGSSPRLYVQDLASGPPRPLSPEGYRLPSMGSSVSPDGKTVIALDVEEKPVFFPTDGGEPIPVPYLLSGDMPIQWTADGRSLFYYEPEESAAKVLRLDLVKQRSEVVRELLPFRPAGMLGHYRIVMTPDGGSYAYSYSRVQADLKLVEDLR